jgi:hypothetical protein
MDTHLLSARLYSGSISPGGGPWKYTAPVDPADAESLVAAFNGGFKMADAAGGYYTEGKMVYPLRNGAASFVIYQGGYVSIGTYGTEVTMTPEVTDVRQNLVLLVDNGAPTAAALSSDWQAWGATVTTGASTWRSAVGITANGALVYAAGPALEPAQLADLMVRAGAIRAMQMDINPDWTVMATYDPPLGSPASPSNGSKVVPGSVEGPWTFFEPFWARDFITMSAR